LFIVMKLFRLAFGAAPVTLAVAASFAAPAAAQQSSIALQPTVITATRFPENRDPLPLGVSVITSDQIRAAGVTTVNDAVVRLLGVPGKQDLSNGGSTGFDLRGFGATADANQVVMLDGVRLSEADLSSPRLAGIPIDSIDRIEVLRGSGAVLYGEGATGGVVVITTKAGAGRQRTSGATLYGAVGSDNLRDARATATVSTEAGFVFDVDAQKRKTDGFRDNSASDTQAGSVTGQWSNGWLRLGGSIGQDKLDAGLPGELTAGEYAANPKHTAKPNDHIAIRNDRASVFAQADVADWQLAFDAAQREKELRSQSSFRSNAVDFALFVNPSDYNYDVDAHNFALRARNDRKLDSATNILVLGVDRNEWKRTGVTNASDADQVADAIYLKDDVVFGAGTRLSAGGRTEKIHKEGVDAVTGSGVAVSDRLNAWDLGLSHPIAASWTAWFRVGHSYRLPNADEFSFTSPGVILKPQESTDSEVGARWTYAAGKVEARVFHSALTNEIGFDPNAISPFGPFGSGANVNFDPTLREGLELDWNHAVTERLGVQVNAIARRAVFRAGPYESKDVPLVPRGSVAVRADWVPVAGHRLNAGVNWVSSQHPDYENACKIPSYATADARYAWQFLRNAEFALGVTNLFDHKYYTQAFGCAAGTTTSIYPEPGRQFTSSVRVQF
jgi:iron complex outermembrane recepter protein